MVRAFLCKIGWHNFKSYREIVKYNPKNTYQFAVFRICNKCGYEKKIFEKK